MMRHHSSANPNEPETSFGTAASSSSRQNNKTETMSDLLRDMRQAPTSVLLQTARDIVNEKVSQSRALDLAAVERLPSFSIHDVKIGKVVGRGGFCTVHEVKALGSAMAMSLSTDANRSRGGHSHLPSLSQLMGRRQQNEPSSTVMSANSGFGSDWESNNSGHAGDGAHHHSNHRQHQSVMVETTGAWRHYDRNKKYVLKRLSPDQLDRITFLKGTVDMAMETRFLSSLDHINIIKLYGVSSDGPFHEGYFVILERMEETLTRRIKKWMDTDRQCKGITGYFTSSKKKMHNMQVERVLAAFEIAKATQYLHERSIIFRDLKPDNIGFNAAGVLKMFDFGLAKELRDDERIENGLYKMTGFTGALRYMAPEVGLRQPYNLAADVYSWAMILWYMLALEPPFGLYPPKMIEDRVFRKGYRPQTFSTWSSRISSIMRRAWHQEWRERPTLNEVAIVMKNELADIDPKYAVLMDARELRMPGISE